MIAITVLYGCGNHDTSDKKNGLHIVGAGEYYWHVSDEYGYVLVIESDGVEVTGTAKENTLIDIKDDVTYLTLLDLNQGEACIDILASSRDEETKGINLMFNGENKVSQIDSVRQLTIEGCSDSSKLNVINSIAVTENLCVKDGTISANYIEVLNDMQIIGNSCVFLEARNSLDSDIIERLSVSGKLFFDLNEQGYVKCIGDNNTDAIIAYEGIELINKSTISSPEGGHILFDAEGDFYSIYNSKNEIAQHVIINGL